MSLKGNLSSVNLTEIFQMLSLSGREGTLFIYEGARKRAICFTKDGVSIRSRERNESNLIGKILVRLGKIDERQLTSAIEERRSGNRLLGDVLIDVDACTREDVDLAFRIQSEEDIQELFLNRSDAQFEYVDGYFPDADSPFVNLNVNSLLIEIARRTDEWEYIRRRIRGPREIYRFTGVEGAVEADVLAECYATRIDPVIDGSHSVGEVIDLSYVNKFEVCKLLAAYLDAGVIELVPPDAIRHSARLALRMGDSTSAIRHYEYLMSTGDFPLDVMSEAAEAHESNRDYSEAAALLRRLAEELVRAGDCRGAIDALRRVANYPRPEPEALRFLLDLVFQNPRAAAEFSAHIVEAGKTLVAYHLKHDQRAEALELLQRLVAEFPDEIAYAVSLVNIHYEEGNVPLAAAECERLAAAYLKRRRTSPAVSLYKKLLIMDPDRQDVREKIRKISSGKKRRLPGALTRLAIAASVALLVGGAAVVLVRHEGERGGTKDGIDSTTLTELLGRAVEEQSAAEKHGTGAVEEFQKLLEQLGQDPLLGKELLLERLKSAESINRLFEERAEKAMSIAETIRRQTADEVVAARARAMLASTQDRAVKVRAEYARWRAAAQQAAERLREQALVDYPAGRLNDALERFLLARTLATRREWKGDAELDRYIQNIRSDVERARRQIEMARAREDAGDWVGARRAYLEVIREFKKADLAQEIRLPVEILSLPPGATIRLDGAEVPQKTPAMVRISPFAETAVTLEKRSFLPESFQLGPFGESTDPAKYEYTRALLKSATWSQSLRDQVEANPAVWGSRVAAAGRNGKWTVLDAVSGKQIASGSLRSVDGVAGGLVADDANFYVPTLDGKVYVFDAVACKHKFTLAGYESGFYGSPVVERGVLYAVEHGGHASATEIATKKQLWRVPTSHGVRAAPVVAGDDVVVVSMTGDVTVIRKATGEVLIRYQVRGTVTAAPAVASSGDLVFATEEGMLYGIERRTGSRRWTYDAKSPLSGTPPVKGRAVFIGPRPGELVAIDTNTGDEIYRYTKSHLSARAAVAKADRIFFVNGPSLSAFAPSSADGYGLAWTFVAKGRILSGPVLSEGAVFIGDDKGNFYRLEAED